MQYPLVSTLKMQIALVIWKARNAWLGEGINHLIENVLTILKGQRVVGDGVNG